MQKNQITHFSNSFKPAQLRTGAVWYVEYYITDPYTGEWLRVRKKINSIKNVAERRRYARHLINQINTDLYSGINPKLNKDSPRIYTRMSEAVELFIELKSKELKPESMRSYRSFALTFTTWITKNRDINTFFVSSMSKNDAVEMMNHFYISKNLSNKTYNNYLAWFSSLFSWLISHQYVNVNVFSGIKSKKNQPKNRILVPESDRKTIKNWLQEYSEPMYICSLLVFHCGIRPNEITFLTPKDINLENQTITVTPEAAKNGIMRVSTIPNSIIKDISEYLSSRSIPDGGYVFGYGFKNHKKKLSKRLYNTIWSKMRKALNLPQTIKFYSLRDSGIVQMLNDGISPEMVMRQFGHSSLEVTTMYLKHANPSGIEQIKKKGSNF